ncbi:hypothetical protein GALMADRAFT_65210 [Galerina marginata CBS 339.88]|uniref:RRM domain-containing protein n=1 Tax=Galerina marginata (strain CBS 339.88) TaxID=685588 RepID=A0A067T4Q8_GALM3|nr:hypothetical protein GALMADRAFT_65210 [Galerina marginata CBS 339.88]
MFSSALRSQARLSLLSTARSTAVPASRSLSSFLVRQAVPAAPVSVSVSRLAVSSRAFSSARVLCYEERERDAAPTDPSVSIYIGNMPWSMTKEDLADMFAEFGEVDNVRLQTHADGRPRGFAHITFVTKESAVAAVTSAREEPLHVSGRDLVVDYARQPASTYTGVDPSPRMYFNRFSADEPALRNFFGEFSDSIVSVFFMRDGNTGEKLNSGFVEFKDVETATEVISKLDGSQLEDGETIRLSYARARKEGNVPGNRRNNARQERSPRRAHYTSREYRGDREDSRGGYGGGGGGRDSYGGGGGGGRDNYGGGRDSFGGGRDRF